MYVRGKNLTFSIKKLRRAYDGRLLSRNYSAYLWECHVKLRESVIKITMSAFLGIGSIKFTIYRHTPFHRIVAGYWCQGGDVTKFNGTGGTSIYGDSFDNENFELRHVASGVLSMCPNDNGRNDSKFNLTFKRLETMDGNRVVFGRVIAGMANVHKVTSASWGAVSFLLLRR